jgi:hypothetical protein
VNKLIIGVTHKLQFNLYHMGVGDLNLCTMGLPAGLLALGLMVWWYTRALHGQLDWCISCNAQSIKVYN